MAKDFNVLDFVGNITSKSAPGLLEYKKKSQKDPLSVIPEATQKQMTQKQKDQFTKSFKSDFDILEDIIKPIAAKPVQKIVIESLNKGELDKGTAEDILDKFKLAPKTKIGAPEKQLPTAQKFEVFEQTPQFKELGFLEKMSIVSGVIGESVKEAGVVTGQFAEEKAQEAEAEGDDFLARIYRTAGAVGEIPTTQLGTAAEKIAFEGLGEGLQPLLVGGATSTPPGMLFNAVISQPEIAPHAEKVFQSYEGAKERFFELYPDIPAQQYINVAFDLALFGGLSKVSKGVVPNEVKIKIPGTEKYVKVSKNKEWWDKAEKEVNKNLSDIGSDPVTYIEKIKKGKIEVPKEVENRAIQVSKDLNAWQKMKVQVQDNMLVQRAVQERIGKKGGIIKEGKDVYLNELLYPGRVRSAVDTFYKESITGIADDLARANSSLDDLGELMWMRHAKERNAKLGDGAAGIKTRAAELKLVELATSGKASALEQAATKIRKLADDLLDYQLKNELIDVKTYSSIKNTYENYVPLQRLMPETEAFVNVGKGKSIVGKELKRAKGSELKVLNPVESLLINWQKSIVRAEKNKVAKSVYEFANEFPENPLYEIVGPEFRMKKNVMEAKVGGDSKFIQVKDKNLARALLNLDTSSANILLRLMHGGTRLFSAINTSLNPEFILTNGVRDLQQSILNVLPELGTGAAASIARNVIPAQKGIWKALRSKSDTAWSKWFKELEAEGGTTGFFKFRDREKVVKDIAKEVESIAGSSISGKFKKYGESIGKVIEDANTVVENSTRTAIYRYARENLGVSKKRAAEIAKNVTVNFNKKGLWGSTLNSLFAFANASIQGSFRTLKVLGTPKGFGTTMALVGGPAVAVNAWNEHIAPFWSSRIPDYVRQTNYVIFLADDPEAVIKIPLPWGFNVVKAVADEGYMVSRGKKEISEATGDSIAALFNAYNPIGGSNVLQALVPTLARPFYDVATNEAWYGGKIAPAYDDKLKDSTQYWAGVDDTFKKLSASISRLTGGEGLEAGAIEVSPEALEYLWNSYTGGLGRFVKNLSQTGSAVVQGEELDPAKIPIARRFFGISLESAALSALDEVESRSKSKQFTQKELAGYQDLLNKLVEEGFLSEEDYVQKVNDLNRDQGKVKEVSTLIEEIKKQNPNTKFTGTDIEKVFMKLEQQGVKLDSGQKKAIEGSLL